MNEPRKWASPCASKGSEKLPISTHIAAAACDRKQPKKEVTYDLLIDREKLNITVLEFHSRITCCLNSIASRVSYEEKLSRPEMIR